MVIVGHSRIVRVYDLVAYLPAEFGQGGLGWPHFSRCIRRTRKRHPQLGVSLLDCVGCPDFPVHGRLGVGRLGDQVNRGVYVIEARLALTGSPKLDLHWRRVAF